MAKVNLYEAKTNLPAVRSAVLDPTNEVFVSSAVGWEIAIKRALGRLDFDGRVTDAVVEEGFSALPIQLPHTTRSRASPRSTETHSAACSSLRPGSKA